MRELLFGTAAAMTVAGAASLSAAWPEPSRPMLALFAPGSSHARIMHAIAEADGRVLELNATHPVAISIGTGPDYAGALYRAGAWLVVDAAFAKLCTRAPSPNGDGM